MNGGNGSRKQNEASEFTLTQDEVRRLIEAAGIQRNRVLIEVLAFTGLRRAEAVALNVEDVDAVRLRAIVRDGKGEKSRIVPITQRLATDVKALAGKRKTGPVFLSTHGKNQRLDERAVNYIVADAGKRADITNPNPSRVEVNPHLLRHTFARHWLSAGGDLRKVSQVLGHESVEITHRIYGTASEEEVADDYSRVFDRPQE